MEQQQHTPTPWRISGSDEHGRYVVESEDESVMYDVALFADYRDAEWICSVVVSHHDLLTALQLVELQLLDSTGKRRAFQAMNPDDLLDTVRAAIAKAEGDKGEGQQP